MKWLKTLITSFWTITLALVIGVIGSLIAGRMQGKENELLLRFFRKAADHPKLSILLTATIITTLVLIWIVHRKERFTASWEICKPAGRITPEDFRIQKYDNAYIARESDKTLKQILQSGGNALIVGKPKIGKTRSAYETIKQLENFSLIKLSEEAAESDRFRDIKFIVRRNYVLFVDDLDRFIGQSVDDLLIRLLTKAPNLLLVATCRTGDELRLVKDQLLSLYREFKVVEVADISPDEGQRLALSAGLPWKPKEFDGTPGSVTLDLEDMASRYEKSKDGKVVLRALKLLREGNLFFRQSLLKEVCGGVFELPAEKMMKYVWDETLGNLKRLGFITTVDDILYVYPSYLEVCVHDYEPANDLEKLRRLLVAMQDSRSLLYLGNSYSYFKRDFSSAANCFKEAIKIYPNYPAAHNSLGYSLASIAETHRMMGRLVEAEELLKEAEGEYRAAITLRPDHVAALVNLSYLLGMLDRHEEAERYVRKAIELKPGYAQAHNNLSYVLINRGNFDEAERELAKAMTLRPDYPQAYASLGFLKMRQAKFVEAEHAYRTALKLKPDYVEVHRSLGHLLTTLERYDEAEQAYRKAMSLMPSHLGIRMNLGRLLAARKRYGEAERLYRSILRTRPEHHSARLQLGYVLVAGQKYDEAQAEFNRALRLKPDYVEALTMLGYLFTETKRYEEAEDVYKRAIEMNPQYAEARANLGHLLEQVGRPEEAILRYREALALKPDHAETHASLAYLLVQLLRYDEAEVEYRKGLEFAPRDPKIHSNLGWLLTRIGRHEEAKAEYRLSIALSPDRAEVHTNLGYLLTQMKRFQEAESEYRLAIDIKNDHMEAYTSLGHLLLETERLEEAEELYKSALKINPNNSEIHESLGYLHVCARNYEEGERELREALRINSRSARAHRHLGYLLSKLNRFEEAEREYRITIELTPDNKESELCLAVVLERLGRDEEAEAAYLNAIKKFPGDVKISQTYQYFLRERGRLEEAANLSTQIIFADLENETDDRTVTKVARFLLKSGNVEQAHRGLLKAVSLNPDNAEAQKNLGKTFERLGDAETHDQEKVNLYLKAEAAYLLSIKIKPRWVSAHRHLARLSAKLGKQNEAENFYQKAQSIRREAKTHRDYGMFLSRLGRIEESVRELESARNMFDREAKKKEAAQVEALIGEVASTT